jgi:hypothetical protein
MTMTSIDRDVYGRLLRNVTVLFRLAPCWRGRFISGANQRACVELNAEAEELAYQVSL